MKFFRIFPSSSGSTTNRADIEIDERPDDDETVGKKVDN